MTHTSPLPREMTTWVERGYVALAVFAMASTLPPMVFALSRANGRIATSDLAYMFGCMAVFVDIVVGLAFVGAVRRFRTRWGAVRRQLDAVSVEECQRWKRDNAPSETGGCVAALVTVNSIMTLVSTIAVRLEGGDTRPFVYVFLSTAVWFGTASVLSYTASRRLNAIDEALLAQSDTRLVDWFSDPASAARRALHYVHVPSSSVA
jgi:FtsH-binding integral membrane protein